jgi:hypothetical protein
MRTVGGVVALGLLLTACGPPGVEQPTAPATAVTSAEVVAAFAAAGLEAEHPRPMAIADYGMAPRRTEDATHFLIPSLGTDASGRVMVFERLEDLTETRDYFEELGRRDEQFRSWVLTREPLLVLVQLNGELAEERAQRYDEVLQDL